jgi:hypothetical protein
MTLLPASPTARRREEELRERARAEAFERGYAHGHAYAQAMGVAARPSSPSSRATPPPAPAPAIRKLALDIGQDRTLLPEAVTISRTFIDEGEEIATHISFGHVTLTIEEAVREGVLDLAGRFDHYRAGAILHSHPQPGAWVHPMADAARPARPRL